MKYIASCSFGKDSLAMVLKLLELKEPLDEVIFFDTGMEFQAIYNLRDKMKPIFEKSGIKFTELHMKESFVYNMIKRPVNGWKNGFHYGYGWCGGTCRWGTTEKTRIIDEYKASLHEEIVEYIGIAVDEPERIRKKNYPLVRWNMTEADCLAYCYSKGFNWIEQSTPPRNQIDLYEILDRVSCWCCRNKNKKELYMIWKYLPQYWERLKDFQRQIPEPFKKYCIKGIFYGDIFSLEKYFERGCKIEEG